MSLRSREWRFAVAAVLAVSAAFVAVFFWGRRLGGQVLLDAAPFVGVWRFRPNVAIVVGALFAIVIVWKGGDVAERLSWPLLLICAFVALAGWAIALALIDGPRGLTMGLQSSHDYLAVVGHVRAPGEFLLTFTDRITAYPVHVRSHPPGLVLGLWWLARAGLDGVVAPAAIAIAAGASAVPAALIAAKEFSGASLARRAAPFLVLSPAAIWLVVSADALYTGVAAWAIAASVMAATRDGARADLLAFAAGVLLGAGLFLSYAFALVAVIALAFPIAQHRYRSLVLSAAAAAGVVALFALNGFWWLDGLAASRTEYAKGVASIRPFAYFVVANLVAFAVALGPSAVGGLTLVRERGLGLLVWPAVAAVVVADLSGLSKGEVERIWLPFWPWIALAAAALAVRGRRLWLTANALVALVLASVLVTPW